MFPPFLHRLILSVSVVALTLMAGCRDDTGISVDGFEALTNQGWLLTGFTIHYSFNPGLPLNFKGEIDALDSAQTCELDDVIHFAADNSYQLIDEGQACPDSPEDGIRETGIWALSADQRSLTIDLLKNQRYLGSLKTIDLESTTFQVKRFHAHVLTLILKLREEYRSTPTSKPIEYDLDIVLELKPA